MFFRSEKLMLVANRTYGVIQEKKDTQHYLIKPRIISSGLDKTNMIKSHCRERHPKN